MLCGESALRCGGSRRTKTGGGSGKGGSRQLGEYRSPRPCRAACVIRQTLCECWASVTDAGPAFTQRLGAYSAKCRAECIDRLCLWTVRTATDVSMSWLTILATMTCLEKPELHVRRVLAPSLVGGGRGDGGTPRGMPRRPISARHCVSNKVDRRGHVV